jgi:hypothetical protein
MKMKMNKPTNFPPIPSTHHGPNQLPDLQMVESLINESRAMRIRVRGWTVHEPLAEKATIIGDALMLASTQLECLAEIIVTRANAPRRRRRSPSKPEKLELFPVAGEEQTP